MKRKLIDLNPTIWDDKDNLEEQCRLQISQQTIRDFSRVDHELDERIVGALRDSLDTHLQLLNGGVMHEKSFEDLMADDET